MLGLQATVSQLIYRYLARGGGQGEAKQKTVEEEVGEADQKTVGEADQKTRLLLSLVQDIHTSANILQHRTNKAKTTV